MKAVRMHQSGPVEKFVYEDVVALLIAASEGADAR